MQFHIETMTCGGCARGVTKAIQSVDATATVQADPPNRRVDVTTTAPRDRIVAAPTTRESRARREEDEAGVSLTTALPRS